MKICKIFLILLFITANQIFSQKTIYLADKISKIGIENVNAAFFNGNLLSDKNGRVKFSAINYADTIAFTHVSYESKKINYYEISQIDTLFLTLKNYVTDDVTITTKTTSSQTKQVYKVDETKKALFNTTGDMLKFDAGIYVKDYGGDNGVKSVSLRGLSSENTIVLFNEARINDLRTGMFDFSLISPLLINKMEVYKNTDFNGSNISEGGIIKLVSGDNITENKLLAGLKTNTDNLFSGFFNVERVAGNFSYAINFERSYSSNNYDYSFEGKDYDRKNAFFSKYFVSSTVAYKNSFNVLKAYFHLTELNSGIPGFVVTNNTQSSQASNNSRSMLAILTDDLQISNSISLLSMLSFNKQNLKLKDPYMQIFSNKTEQKSLLNDFSGKFKLQYFAKDWILNLGYELYYSDLKNDLPTEQNKILKLNKTSNKVFASGTYKNSSLLKFVDNFQLMALTSYEIINEKIFGHNNDYIPAYKISLRFESIGIKNINLILNNSISKRAPSFNEQFYSCLYNIKALNDEKYKSWDATIDYSFNFFGNEKISVTYYDIISKDKIVWIPSRQALQVPKNYGHIRHKGIEVEYSGKYFDNALGLTLLYNNNSAKSKSLMYSGDNSYNKQLVYTPEHKINCKLDFTYKNWNWLLYGMFTSERYYTNDNSPQNRLDSYFTIDAALTYRFDFYNIKNNLTVAVNNMLNENYFIIQSYPMPLRTITFTYILEI